MADSTQNILVQVGADIADLTRGMKEVQEHIKGVGETTENASAKGGVSLGKLAGALGLVTAASKGIGMIKDSISSAFGRIDTMESFNQVMTVLTGSSEKAAQALDVTREAVTGTAYGLDVAAKGVQDFVTRGMEIEKATSVMSAWGDAVAFYGDGSNEQLANVSDALAKMTSSGKVHMDQMNRLYDAGIDGPGMYAQATGQNVDDVQKALSKGEISAEDFIDTVTNAMMEGTNGVVQIKGAAKEAGASWGASFDNMRAAVTRGVVEIIQEIDRMLVENGLPDMREMVAEFGRKFEAALKKVVEYIPPVAKALKKVHDTLKPWYPLITAVVLAVGSFVAISATVTTAISTWGKLVATFNALKVVLAATNPWIFAIAAIIGLAYLVYKYWDEIVMYTKIAWEWIKEFMSNLWNGIKATFTKVWDAIKNNLQTTWAGVKFVAETVWSGIVDFFTGIWDSVSGIFKSVWDKISNNLETTWNGIVFVAEMIWTKLRDIIDNIIAPMVENVMKHFNSIKDGIMTVFEGVITYFSGIWELIKNVFLGAILLIYDLVTGNFTDLKTDALAIWENIRVAFAQIWEGIKMIFMGALDIIVGYFGIMWETAKGIAMTTWEFIKSYFITVWNVLKSVFSAVWESVKAKATAIWNALKAFFSATWDAIKAKSKAVWDSVKATVESIWNRIKDFFTNTWNTIKAIFTTVLPELYNTVKTNVTDMFNAVREWMSKIPGKVSEIWGEVTSFLSGIDLAQIGKDIISGLIRGITSMAGKLVDGVKEMVNKIPSTIRNVLGIASPSKVTTELGVFTGQGLVKGVRKMRSDIMSVASMASDWLTPDTPDLQPYSLPSPNGARGIRYSSQSKHIDEVIDERNNREDNPQPLHVNLTLGGRDYEAFVEDIDRTTKRKNDLKRKLTGRD